MWASRLIRSSWQLAIHAFILSSLVTATDPTKKQLKNRSRTVYLGITLFPGFEPLDVIGFLTPFISLSSRYPIKLIMIGENAGPIGTLIPPHVMVPGQPPVSFPNMMNLDFVATHSYQNVPNLDLLMVPGGMGSMVLVEQNNTWIEELIQDKMPKLEYLLSVCTGSVNLARAGVLKRKRATTNKALWPWVTSFGDKVKWVPSARWTSDGKIWTSSGVAAGIDMVYAFLKMFYGTDPVNSIFNAFEYAPHTDPHWDPFSIVHNVPGADPHGSLTSCVRPAGY